MTQLLPSPRETSGASRLPMTQKETSLSKSRALPRSPLAVPILVILLSVGAFAAWHFIRTPQPVAHAEGILVLPGAKDLTEQNLAEFTAKSRAKSYVVFGNDTQVLETAAEELDISGGATWVADHVTVTQPLDTALLDVEATAATDDLAHELADTMIDALAQRIDELQADSPQEARVRLEPVSTPVSSSAKTAGLGADLLTGLVVGLLLALAVARIPSERFSQRRRP